MSSEDFYAVDLPVRTASSLARRLVGSHRLIGMKHAGPSALATIEPLLTELRTINALTEKRPGVFYRKSAAFLHFHEDPAGMFADIRVSGEWQRLPVDTTAQRRRLVQLAAKPD
jgi:hypothetical protein